MSTAGRRPSRPVRETGRRKLSPLSATMVACIDDALEAGGELIRYQGGYWAARNAPRASDGIPRPYHGTPTVEALVARGEAEYSEYRDGRNGQFPIAVRIGPKSERA